MLELDSVICFMASHWLLIIEVLLGLAAGALVVLAELGQRHPRRSHPILRVGALRVLGGVGVLSLVFLGAMLAGCVIPAPAAWLGNLPAAQSRAITETIRAHDEPVSVITFWDITSRNVSPAMAGQLKSLKKYS